LQRKTKANKNPGKRAVEGIFSYVGSSKSVSGFPFQGMLTNAQDLDPGHCELPLSELFFQGFFLSLTSV